MLHVEQNINNYIRLATQQLIACVPEMSILALSLPLSISENRIIDLEIVRWVQWVDQAIDAEGLFNRNEQRLLKWDRLV